MKKTVIDELHGSVTVDSTPGMGTTFTLQLPLSLATMHVLVVRTGGSLFGFTAQYVADLVRRDENEFMSVAGRPAVAIRDEFVPVLRLDELLGLDAGTTGGKRGTGVLLLVVKERSDRLALAIDELVDEGDMIIKPLPAHLRKTSLVSGMVSSEGDFVGVLRIPALLELARRTRGEAAGPEPGGKALSAPSILVVDDSPNTREIERDVLEAHGYRVTLAEDGLDGLRRASDESFDAVITDIEMPNMNGFALTERLRSEERYRDTPIVIVTSRSKEEDKRRGVQAGADAYIVKGDFEQDTLVDTLRRLGL